LQRNFHLFSPPGKLAERAMFFTFRNFFLFIFFLMISREQLSQDMLDRFSQSFHRMQAFWVQMIDLDLFYRYLKGRCHGNQFCQKMAFGNGMG